MFDVERQSIIANSKTEFSFAIIRQPLSESQGIFLMFEKAHLVCDTPLYWFRETFQVVRGSLGIEYAHLKAEPLKKFLLGNYFSVPYFIPRYTDFNEAFNV